MKQKRLINIDGKRYLVDIFKKRLMPPAVPRLVIASHQQNSTAKELIRVCLDGILKHTVKPYELWISASCSSKENIKWLFDYSDLNVIFNHNRYVNNGSYNNGVALEIAKKTIKADCKYLATLHMDTLVCKEEWLSYLLSKFNKRTRAVGVRMDKSRTREGVLQALGAVFDFQLIRKLKLSFMPQLPHHDVGDLVSIGIRKAGYKIFACRNTLTEPELIKEILKTSHFRNFNVDRVLDDEGEVFFLHLGRGIGKSIREYKDESKTSPQQWINFARNFILSDSHFPQRLTDRSISPQADKINYSLRRYYVDEFYKRNISYFLKKGKILDIGGKKKRKRGQFNIEKYNFTVKYANIDKKTDPDYICDAVSIPVSDKFFDGIICSEVLEHVSDPRAVLVEIYRVLKPNGVLLLCSPFMFPIHADPYDYGRYTDFYWKDSLKKIGFSNIIIEKQGLFFSVLASMLKLFAYELRKKGKPKNKLIRKVFHRIIGWNVKQALKLDNKFQNQKFFRRFTTGFGVIARK